MTKHNTPCYDNPDQWFREFPANASDETKHRVLVDIKNAKRICETCPVSLQCRTEGMKPENLYHGIWGELFAGERLMMAGIYPPPADNPNRERNTQEIRAAYNLLYAIKPYLKVG